MNDGQQQHQLVLQDPNLQGLSVLSKDNEITLQLGIEKQFGKNCPSRCDFSGVIQWMESLQPRIVDRIIKLVVCLDCIFSEDEEDDSYYNDPYNVNLVHLEVLVQSIRRKLTNIQSLLVTCRKYYGEDGDEHITYGRFKYAIAVVLPVSAYPNLTTLEIRDGGWYLCGVPSPAINLSDKASSCTISVPVKFCMDHAVNGYCLEIVFAKTDGKDVPLTLSRSNSRPLRIGKDSFPLHFIETLFGGLSHKSLDNIGSICIPLEVNQERVFGEISVDRRVYEKSRSKPILMFKENPDCMEYIYFLLTKCHMHNLYTSLDAVVISAGTGIENTGGANSTAESTNNATIESEEKKDAIGVDETSSSRSGGGGIDDKDRQIEYLQNRIKHLEDKELGQRHEIKSLKEMNKAITDRFTSQLVELGGSSKKELEELERKYEELQQKYREVEEENRNIRNEIGEKLLSFSQRFT